MCRSKQPAKLAMLVVLPFLLLCYGVGNIHCSTIHENREDLRSLLDFKKAITNDPYGALSNWNTSTHFCRWYGVNCSSTRPLRVTELNLTGQSLSGQISSSLGNLTFLKALYVRSNSFAGPIPALNNLQHLEILFLQSNFLQGVIPDTLTNCSNLAYLGLSQNLLTGVIPPSIGSLSKLAGLNLRQNNLTGIIPPSLGNITTIQVVNLGENQLSGIIPNSFWHTQNIAWLYLYENNLSGEIPQTLSNFSSLTQLSLSVNMLDNTLPSNIGDALPNLQLLYLGANMFQGHIPASLGNASKLTDIGLGSNNFTGQIPSSLGKLSGLQYLELSGNMLEAGDNDGWQFLHALANCASLYALLLANNQLQGAIPNYIANLTTNLTYLQMGGNRLSGIVPLSIGKFYGLKELTLDYNNLNGTIEEWIGKLTNLQLLYLQSNNFNGTIPPSISSLTGLIKLSLADNKFTGFIPPSLGSLQHMSYLNLSYNNFQGSIPVEFGNLGQLIELDLSSNKISGEIPDTLAQCKQLFTIQLGQNVLTGNISTTFRNLRSLQILNIPHNILTGNIPVSFSNLISLSTLNLSHNSLSGSIPTTLSHLELLSHLDLSYNHLQGEVPINGVFANATSVSLNDNWGLCGGVMDLQMPMCTEVSQTMDNKHYFIIILITLLFGIISLVMLVYIITRGKKTSRRTYLFSLSFGKKFPKVSYNDLAEATDNFSQLYLIGRGNHGSVYKGKLVQAKMQVAVKVFDLEIRCAERSFISECEALRSIRHRNLLPILTACLTIDNRGNDFKALIYEFMHNGNLDTWLHHRGNDVAKKCLCLDQRISIAVGIADALAYLHHDCGRPIVHCDLKPTNILLDDDMNAHLGDFGIASLIHDSRSTTVGYSASSSSSFAATGTIGYIPPEYAQSVYASTRGDVYSFGIVLLEMLIGKRPTDSMFEGELSIVSFVKRNIPDQMFHIIDAHLQEECKGFIQATAETENEVYRCLLSLVQVAFSCTRLTPRERMNMREVAINLHSIRKAYVQAIKQEQVLLR